MLKPEMAQVGSYQLATPSPSHKGAASAKIVTFSNNAHCQIEDMSSTEEDPVVNGFSTDASTPVKTLSDDFSSDEMAPTSTSTPTPLENGNITSSTNTILRASLRKKSSSSADSILTSEPDEEVATPDSADENKDTEGEEEEEETVGRTDLLKEEDTSCLMVPGAIRVPIVGYEVMESRSKFTLYKVHVVMGDDEVGWFIFRRYSDFVHLNSELQLLFPNFRLSLPPKRWFRDNFDADFLEDRQLGLQAFLNNITGHRDICVSQPVREFFCFDDPPGPHESLEESRVQCECMEEMLFLLRKELEDRSNEVDRLNEKLSLYKNQVQLLTSSLSELNKVCSFRPSSRDSFTEGKLETESLQERVARLLTHPVPTVSDSRQNNVDNKTKAEDK